MKLNHIRNCSPLSRLSKRGISARKEGGTPLFREPGRRLSAEAFNGIILSQLPILNPIPHQIELSRGVAYTGGPILPARFLKCLD